MPAKKKKTVAKANKKSPAPSRAPARRSPKRASGVERSGERSSTTQQALAALSLATDKLTKLEALAPSLNVLRRCYRATQEVESTSPVAQEIAAALSAYATKRGWQLVGHNGRSPPQVGETRRYKVQQTSPDGPGFLRIGTGTLDAHRGDVVRASFEEGKIVLVKDDSGAPVDEDDDDAED